MRKLCNDSRAVPLEPQAVKYSVSTHTKLVFGFVAPDLFFVDTGLFEEYKSLTAKLA